MANVSPPTLTYEGALFGLLAERVRDYAIFMLDPSGLVRTWNIGAERTKGYRADEIIGRHFSSFYTPEDQAAGRPAAGLAATAATGSYEDEGWRVRKDGSRFWANVVITALRDEAGVLTGYAKITRDLTERKRVEDELRAGRDGLERRVRERTAALELANEELRASKARDRAVIDALAAVVWTCDLDGNTINCNPPWHEYFGLPEEVIARYGWKPGLHPDDLDRVLGEVPRLLGTGRPYTQRFRVRKPDGHYRHWHVFAAPVRDCGKIVCWTGVCIDVTEQHNLEEQLRQAQKMEAVGQLAAGVAHDFNNLLTVISGYSELMMTFLAADDPKRSSIQAISDAGERAAGLTRQLLAFSRQSILDPQVLDMNAVIGDTERMLRRVIGEDVQLATVLDPRIGRVRADAGQVGQVLMNLAVNARDAMPRGGKLTIETRNVVLDSAYLNTHVEVAAGRHVLVAVSDNGVGMPSAVRERVFEPFYTTKGVGKGTGLGLSVVHGIVKQSGGVIGAYSEVGLGTTFKIYLPVIDAPVTPLPRAVAFAPARATETVLFVEDEEGVRELSLLVLQDQGYDVVAAANGREAVRFAKALGRDIDVLVTDVVMPEMSGRELAETLRPEFPRMKVLYLSGYTDDAVVRHGILRADVAFLQKPYTPTVLLRKLRSVLDGR
ncbi:hybrid sensor histidine kinase/response regulator [Limnoglobus roseus]|uniref:histidine kinase n=1 Tax=Limnoglobus roseus TaxID=2598579 RepID=A0A5C1ALU8_9BACT|nr:PAS domain-containing sensor histidine kinase [Limnoglobus roseus]QEL20191.1 PAS domain-containing sensor histidine kinase [Limnoglobus roseus]